MTWNTEQRKLAVYKHNKCSYKLVITSLPIMAIEGTVRSHGTSPNAATSKGLVHNNTSVAATISCTQ